MSFSICDEEPYSTLENCLNQCIEKYGYKKIAENYSAASSADYDDWLKEVEDIISSMWVGENPCYDNEINYDSNDEIDNDSIVYE